MFRDFSSAFVRTITSFWVGLVIATYRSEAATRRLRRVILDETGLDHHDGIELQTLDRFSAADADLLIPFGLLDEPCVFGRVKNDSQFAAHGIAHRGDEIIRTDDGDAAGAVCRNELFGKLRRLLGRRFQQGRHVGHHIAGHRIGDGAHRIDRGDVEAFLLGKS